SGDDLAGEYGGFLAHDKLLGVNALLYRLFESYCAHRSLHFQISAYPALPIICAGCLSTVREVFHALITLARHRYRSAGYGRHAAGPALRQPLLDGAPAPALRRVAWCEPGHGRTGVTAVVRAQRRPVTVVLPGLLERGTETAGA